MPETGKLEVRNQKVMSALHDETWSAAGVGLSG
jgi:hypothetical protein